MDTVNNMGHLKGCTIEGHNLNSYFFSFVLETIPIPFGDARGVEMTRFSYKIQRTFYNNHTLSVEWINFIYNRFPDYSFYQVFEYANVLNLIFPLQDKPLVSQTRFKVYPQTKMHV